MACNCDEGYAEEIIEQVSSKMDINADENWNGYMIKAKFFDRKSIFAIFFWAFLNPKNVQKKSKYFSNFKIDSFPS